MSTMQASTKNETAIDKIDEAVAAVEEALRRNAHLQKRFKLGSDEWHACESVDDKLYDALAALGQ